MSGIRRAALAAGTSLLLALTATPVSHAVPHAPASASSATGGQGSLVLVGGALQADNEQIYGEIVRRAGGDRARIGVLTAASVPASRDPHADDPDRCNNSACNGAYYAELFTRHGAAHAEWIPIDLDHPDNADSDEVVRQVESMTGFFFGGGDQYRYVTTMLGADGHTDSRVLAVIRDKLAHGAVVGGTSAGAQIAAGRDMVTGGESYQGLRDGSEPGWFEDATRLGYLPNGGFGFLTSGLIDTHTGAWGREGRALRLAADTGNQRVYALEENSALVVDAPGTPGERMTVLGTQGVAVLDLRRARSAESAAGWSLHGARYSYLTDGDRYVPARWELRPGPGKRPLPPRGDEPVPVNEDVFFSVDNPDGRPYAFRATARALAATRVQRSATATTFEEGPRFTVAFAKRSGAVVAWTSDGTTAHTLVGLEVSVTPG